MERRTFVAGIVGAFVAPATRTSKDGDDTQSVQTAMNVAASQGVPLVLEPRTYVCRSLTVPNGLVMVGNNPGGYGIKIGNHPMLALRAGTNDHLLKGGPDTAHVRITGIHIDANKNNNELGHGIYLESTPTPREAQWHIRDCFIEAAPEHGIYIGYGRRAVQVSDCTLNYNRLNGIRIDASDAHVDRCILGSNGMHGIGVGGTVCNIESCDIYGNGQDGICVYSTIQMVGMHGNRIDRNKRNGITLSGSNKAVSITGSILHSNARTDIHVGPSCSQIEQVANVRGTD